MAVGTLEKLTTKGIERLMMATIESFPDWWRPHCTELPATAKITPFAWPGAAPQPREMVDGRRIQEIRAFNYNISNKTYELSFLIPREWLEDDQTGSIRQLVAQVGEAFGAYKTYLFTYLLEQGGTLTGYDGATFFHDTRIEGNSAAIDNNLTSTAAAGSAIPTSAEFLAEMAVIKALMGRYQDDRARNMNTVALTSVRVIAPRDCEPSMLEALKATQIGGTSNVYGQGLAQPDFNDQFTVDATPTMTMFVHAVGGSTTRAMIYQQRLPLSVVVHDDEQAMDLNDGLLVTCRERFVFAYGNFRKMVKHVFTT